MPHYLLAIADAIARRRDHPRREAAHAHFLTTDDEAPRNVHRRRSETSTQLLPERGSLCMVAGWNRVECKHSRRLRLRHLAGKLTTKMLHWAIVNLHERSPWIRCLGAGPFQLRMDARRGTAGFSSKLGGRLESSLRPFSDLSAEVPDQSWIHVVIVVRRIIVDLGQRDCSVLYRRCHRASCRACRACSPVLCDSIVGTI
ncbi:hypothetical protein LIA77_09828 [Sarocladium implicatum]|nr:hypothetical protein LIA77_09828 [Sarocladium implicatum]